MILSPAQRTWLTQAGSTVLHLAAFYIVIIAVAASVIVLLYLSVSDRSYTLEILAQSIPTVLAVGGITVFLVRRGGWTLHTIGWPRASAGLRSLGVGLTIGVTMATAVVVISTLAGPGGLMLDGASIGNYVATVIPLLLVLLVAALAEELVFRGYPLLKLSRLLGKPGASVALALLFSLAHITNPDVSVFGLLNVALASLVLSAIFFTPGALPAAWGLHFGWNAGLTVVDAPVSGVRFDVPMLDFRPEAPVWLTGGGFGPEGGAIASVVMGAALVFIVRPLLRDREAHDE